MIETELLELQGGTSRQVEDGAEKLLLRAGAGRLLRRFQSAAVLPENVEVCTGDRIGIEYRVGAVARFGSVRASEAAVDHEMRDVDPLRLQLARHALRFGLVEARPPVERGAPLTRIVLMTRHASVDVLATYARHTLHGAR